MDACTIISSNYLPFARTMVKSYRKYHSEGRFFVLVLDKPKDTDFSSEPWETVFAEELGMGEELHALRMLYDAYEMSMSLRPALLLYLMKQKNAEQIVFLDSDLYFIGKLENTEELFQKHALSLCVSIRKPLPDDGNRPLDDDFILAGSLNGGCVFCKKCDESITVMEWLDRTLRKKGYYRPHEGFFGDQKWLDLLPSFCETLGILKKPGWNASYWNLHERPLTKKGSTYFADGDPIAFFHFSGFRPHDPSVISTHQNRYTIDEQPVFAMLADEYRKELLADGYDEWSKKSYGFNAFENGVTISNVIRRAYEEIDGRKRFPYPHLSGVGSFQEWLNFKYRKNSPATNLHMSIWRLSLEARGRFPDPMGKDFGAFALWILKERKRELALDPLFTNILSIVPKLPRRAPRVWLKNILALRHVFEPYQIFCRLVKKIIGKEMFYKLKPKVEHHFGYAYFRLQKTPSRPEGITLVSAASGENGIAHGAREFMKVFQKLGIPSEHVDSRTAPGRQDLVSPLRKKMWYDKTILAGGANEIDSIIHQTEFVIGPNQRMIAYLPWESNILPEGFADGLNQFSEVWTPSTFSKNMLEKHIKPLVSVVPHCIDVQKVEPIQLEQFGCIKNVFTCLYIFDFHSHVQRKNPEAVLRAFLKAFGNDTSAQLLIVATHGKDFPTELAALRSRIKNSPQVFLHTSWTPKHESILGLMQASDCYLSLHRSEGFGLTIAESLALGVPTVATNFGGCTDFLSEQTGWLVPYSTVKLHEPIGPYPAGTLWAEADISAAAETLRFIKEHPAEAKKKALAGAAYMKEHFSVEAVAKHLDEALGHYAAFPKS